MRKLFIIALLFVTGWVNAQTTVDTTIDGYNAVIYRPAKYFIDGNNDSSIHCFVFSYGSGETAASYTTLRTIGGPIPYLLNGGPDSVVINGVSTHFIAIGLRIPTAFPTSGQPLAKLNAIRAAFKIKKTNLHVGGFSAGGYAYKIMATEDAYDATEPYGPFTYADAFKSIIDVQGVLPDDNAQWYDKCKNFAHNNVTGGGKYIGFWGTGDGDRSIPRFADSMNAAVPASASVFTTSDAHSYTAVHRVYGYPDGTDPQTWTINGVTQTAYEWAIRNGDTVAGDPPPPPSASANAGSDASYAYSQNGDSVIFNLSGTSASTVGTVSYSWAVITGNPSTTHISNPTDSATTVTGANVAGYYSYEFSVTDDNGTYVDTVVINLRDWMQKNVTACRSGTKQKFIINTATHTTDVYLPYINRDNVFGQSVMGGDTILIESGNYTTIEIGDFGGNNSCPVIVMTDSVVNYGGVGKYFRIANKDSNAVVYTHFNGLANRTAKGVVYGFQYKNSGATDVNGFAMVGNMVHHIEIDGVSAENVGVGFFFKKNSDTSGVWSYYDKYRLAKLSFHDLYLYRINGEGFYIGHTSINGNPLDQPGNNGHTNIADSLYFGRIIIDSTFWDGLQTSNAGYGTIIEDILTNRTGQGDVSSQQFSGFGGGNMQSTIRRSVFINGTGPMGMLGKGYGLVDSCIVDSAYTSASNCDGLYAQMNNTTSTLDNPLDSLVLSVKNSIFSRIQRYAINVANSTGAMKKDSLINNLFVDPSRSTAALINNSVTNKYESGNTTVTSLDLSTSSLKDLEAYRVYNELLRVQPAGTKISFFDLDIIPESPQIRHSYKQVGRRIKIIRN